MPPKKPISVQVPQQTHDEITQVARATERSVAFIVRRALAAAAANAPAPPPGPRVALALTTDEDDPADLLAKIKAAAKDDERIGAAWLATREKFSAWMKKAEEVNAGERADDLDAGLRDGANPNTPPARLTELAESSYPRVRALVAGHAKTPPELFMQLAKDKEPVVRDAVVNNSAAPKAAKEAADY